MLLEKLKEIKASCDERVKIAMNEETEAYLGQDPASITDDLDMLEFRFQWIEETRYTIYRNGLHEMISLFLEEHPNETETQFNELFRGFIHKANQPKEQVNLEEVCRAFLEYAEKKERQVN